MEIFPFSAFWCNFVVAKLLIANLNGHRAVWFCVGKTYKMQ